MKTDITFSMDPLDRDRTVVVLSFSGQLDEMTGDEIFARLSDFLEEKKEENFFIFRLSDLEYINSKSIGHLIDSYRKISGRGGKLVFCEVPENILDILDLVGVTRVIDIAGSLEAAKVSLLTGE